MLDIDQIKAISMIIGVFGGLIIVALILLRLLINNLKEKELEKTKVYEDSIIECVIKF